MTGVPKDFSEVLSKAGLAPFFADCTPSHQREYLKWIDEAKKPETRMKRIAQSVGMISEKRAQETARAKKRLS